MKAYFWRIDCCDVLAYHKQCWGEEYFNEYIAVDLPPSLSSLNYFSISPFALLWYTQVHGTVVSRPTATHPISLHISILYCTEISYNMDL